MARPVDPEKRQAIMFAAKKIIERDGYQSAKIAQIAAEAGVAAGTVYLYFDSKEAIAAALASDFFQKAAALTSKHVPLLMEENGIENYIDAVVEFASTEKCMLAQIKTNPTLADDDYSIKKRRELHGQMAELLQRLMDKNVIERYDPVGLGSIIFGIMHSIIMGSVVFEDFPLKIYKETAAQLLRKSLKPGK
jgi:AcrR family transcriptional regulator